MTISCLLRLKFRSHQIFKHRLGQYPLLAEGVFGGDSPIGSCIAALSLGRKDPVRADGGEGIAKHTARLANCCKDGAAAR